MQANRLEALKVAREVLSAGGPAALATVAADGAPFASYVISAPSPDAAPILLLSRLAVHTANLARDPRASLLLVREPAAGSERAAAERLTLVGRALEHPDQTAAGADYLRHHPDARQYAGFADFRFYRFDTDSAHIVAGFGLISLLTRAELLEPQAASGGCGT